MINQRISLLKGDITKIEADAIVNAANSSLMGGGGVDGAIHKAGGSDILEDCRKIVARQGGCKTGEAVITTAGKLPVQFVIHTVGPVWNGGHINEELLLASCYNKSLELAVKNGINTIAFSNISTGIYHFPKDLACSIALKTVNDFLNKNDTLKKVIFVCFDDENYDYYKNALS